MRCVGPTLARSEIAHIRKSLAFAPEIEEAVELFSLANSSTRLKILLLLDELKELCVCDLAEMLDVSLSAVSQHLAKLRAYGLVTSRREAQTIFYRLTDHPFVGKLHQLVFDQIAVLDDVPARTAKE
jgi:DNA-binding transcriptional ArsR family regulator